MCCPLNNKRNITLSLVLIHLILIGQQTAEVAKGLFATAAEIIASKGPMGLYQGVVPYLVADGLSGAIKFATFELTRRYAEEKLPKKYHALSRFVCAAGAILACSVILVPGEVLKTRLQAGAGGLGLVSVVSQIIKADGVRGLFVGYYSTLVRDVPYTMLELGIYENIKVNTKALSSPHCYRDEVN